MKMKENIRLEERKNTKRKKSKRNYRQQKCHAMHEMISHKKNMVPLGVTTQDPLTRQVDLKKHLSSVLYCASSIQMTVPFIKRQTYFSLFP